MIEYSKCPKCKASIENGVLLCGNCKTQLEWKGGIPKVALAQKLNNASKGLSKAGCLMTLLITLPILFIFCTVL
jgi:hypothetical protein